MYPAIQIGQALLPTFGVVFAIAMIAAVVLCVARARQYGMGRVTALVAALAALCAGVLGDRVMNDALLAHLGRTIPSVAFAAGVATAALAVKVWSLMVGARFSLLADCLSQPVALALAAVRLGCLLAGCDYGQPTDRVWGIAFNNALALAWYRTPIGVRLHPTQLYECLLAVTLLCLLKLMERRQLRNGVQFLSLAAAYSFGRFLIDFLRGDAGRGFWGPLSVPQWFCVLTLVISALQLTLLSRQKAVAAR